MNQKQDKKQQTASQTDDALRDEDQGAGDLPPQTDEQATAPGAQVDSAQCQIEELKESLQRLAADYQNYQKRSQRQMEQAVQLALEGLAKSLLPVLDNFSHALAGGNQGQEVAEVLEGVQIVYDHLYSTLASQGLTPIEVHAGDPFDPSLHEAMMHQESGEFEENVILQELARGYRMNERTLRPTKVIVAKALAPLAEEGAASADSPEPGAEPPQEP